MTETGTPILQVRPHKFCLRYRDSFPKYIWAYIANASDNIGCQKAIGLPYKSYHGVSNSSDENTPTKKIGIDKPISRFTILHADYDVFIPACNLV